MDTTRTDRVMQRRADRVGGVLMSRRALVRSAVTGAAAFSLPWSRRPFYTMM